MIVAALALALVSRAEAGIEKAGTTAANFLSLGAGAGILGMGGASLGATGDLNLLNWNVASLGQLNETEFVISHAGLNNQSSQEWAAVGGRLGHTATRWALSGLYQGDGSFEGRDALGGSTGSFNVSSMAFGGHLAQNVGDHVAIGLGAKFVSENLGSVSGWGGTFDAGLQFRSNGLGLGLAAQNFGGRMMYGGTPYPMPTNVGVGAAYEIPGSGLRLALDANFPSAYYSDVRGGVEWRWKDRLALRTGYRSEMGSSSDALTGPTFGMGAGMRGMWFDYGYLVGGGAGDGEHRIGLSFHPGAFNWSGEEMDAAPRTQTEAPAKPSVRATTAKSESKTKATPSESNAIAPAVKPVSVTPSPVPPAAKPTSIAPATTSKPTSDATPKTVTPADAAPKTVPVTPAATTAPTPKATMPVETPKSAVATPSKLGPPLPSTTPAPMPKVVTPVATPATKVDAPKTTVIKTETPKTDAVKTADVPKTDAAKSATTTTPETTKSTDAATPASAPKTDDASAKSDAPAATDGAKSGEPAKEAPAKAVAPSATPIPTYRPSSKPAPAGEASTPVVRPAKVQVKKGDTLYSIAKAYGTSAAAIMMENNMVSENVKTGQTLKLPKN
jgi:LysM repeat protein